MSRHHAAVSEGPRPIVVVILLVIMLLILAAVFAAIKVFLLQRPIVAEQGSIEVAFCQQSSCEKAMLATLHNAAQVHCAFYELNHENITTDLRNTRAVVLIDEDNVAKANMTVASVPSKGLMHHKFCTIIARDGSRKIITGSMNPTKNDVERNDNNLLVISSDTLNKRYEAEWVAMRERTNKEYKKSTGSGIVLNISGVLVEQYFCPQEFCENAVIHALMQARREINFMTFSFTSDEIGNVLLEKSRQGVHISGVFETRQIDQWTEYERLVDENISVKKDLNKYTMHHKVFIIDNSTVITGSYNPTSNADERNDENLLIIHDKEIARQYRAEFNRIYS